MQNRTSDVEIQLASTRLRRVISLLFASLAALLVLERFGAIAADVVRRGNDADVLRRIAVQAVSACPEVLYLLALWWIRQALASFAKGSLFTPTIAQMIDRVGVTLAAGAFIGVFLVPSALRALGNGPGYLIAYDIGGLVLGALGLSLKVIAHVLHRAAAMQAELDEMF
jgi:hypothetical protein